MIALILAAAACAQVSPEPLTLNIDAEKRVTVSAGTFVVFADEAAANDAAWFEELQAAASGGLRRTTASRYRDDNFAFYIGVANEHTSFRDRRLRRWLDGVSQVGPQGYRLLIDKRGVIIAATDRAGVRNGVATLLQLFAEDGSLPQTEIRDEPEIAFRAVRLQERPAADQIRALANAKCNFAIIESADWWVLEGSTAESWRNTFSALRTNGIEPVPAISPMSDAGPLLARAPLAAQTEIDIDQLILSDDTWTPLTHRNIIDTLDAPIRVRANGEYFEAGRDYVIAPGRTSAPFSSENPPWQIRRVASGSIPKSESVDVLYSYIAPGTQIANPQAPEYQTAVRDTIRSIVEVLKPQFLHIGHAQTIAPSRNAGERDPVAESLKTIVDAAGSNLRLIAYANAFRNPRAADYVNLLPRDALLDVRAPYGPPPIGSSGTPDITWTRSLDRALLLSAQTSPLDALSLCEIAARSTNILGIVGEDLDVAKIAWSPGRSTLPWARVLNAYFGTRLWNPGDIEAFEALAAHANEQTARGVSPEKELTQFRTWFEKNRGRLPAEDATFVEGHYTRILEWIRLEAEFNRGDGRSTLRDLTDLVQRHAAATPDYPENRRSTIVHTIDSAGRFVPSTILFGTPVLPYRPINLPGSYTVLEVPVRPQFTDHQGATEVRFDLLESPGPIIRVDFDTLDPTAITVDRSVDGEKFENVQHLKKTATTPLGPPLLMQRPFSAAAFNISLEGNPPVLRDPRVFALKDVPAAICSQTVRPPDLDGSFRETCWPAEAQLSGFVETTHGRFATAATTVRLTYTRDALYLGVYAREPRMETLVANMTSRDGPLWTEEAIEIRFSVGNDEFIFVTNPNGAQFDSKNGNAEWNIDWTTSTRRYATGWSAEIALPFNAIGRQPRSGDDWQFDVVRYRRNVESSMSHWAYRPNVERPRAPGRMIFN